MKSKYYHRFYAFYTTMKTIFLATINLLTQSVYLLFKIVRILIFIVMLAIAFLPLCLLTILLINQEDNPENNDKNYEDIT